MENVETILRKPVIAGVTVGVIVAGIISYILYKRYS